MQKCKMQQYKNTKIQKYKILGFYQPIEHVGIFHAVPPDVRLELHVGGLLSKDNPVRGVRAELRRDGLYNGWIL